MSAVKVMYGNAVSLKYGALTPVPPNRMPLLKVLVPCNGTGQRNFALCFEIKLLKACFTDVTLCLSVLVLHVTF